MKCNKCRKIIPENLIYCPYCGAEIKSNTENFNRAEDSIILYNKKEFDKKNKTHTFAILIFFSIFVIFLMLSVFLFLSANGKLRNKGVNNSKSEFISITVNEKNITAVEVPTDKEETESDTDYYTYPAE